MEKFFKEASNLAIKPGEWKDSELKKSIENRMVDEFKKYLPVELYEQVISQAFPSKRIRSYFLYLLSDDSLDKEDFIKLATSIEIFHQSTLIVDDVLDNTDVREGDRSRLHINHGGGYRGAGIADHIAILLLLLSEKALVEEVTFNQILALFNEAKIKMFKAQLADVFVLNKPNDSTYMDWILDTSYNKTSAFFEYIFDSASMLNSNKVYDSSTAKSIGIIYQIADDLHDIDVGFNAKTISLTYPLAYILDNPQDFSEDENERILAFISQKTLSNENLNELWTILKRNKELIVESAKGVFEKLAKEIKDDDSLSDSQKQSIAEVMEATLSPEYWGYTKI